MSGAVVVLFMSIQLTFLSCSRSLMTSSRGLDAGVHRGRVLVVLAGQRLFLARHVSKPAACSVFIRWASSSMPLVMTSLTAC